MAKRPPRLPKRGAQLPERSVLLTIKVSPAEMAAFKQAAADNGLAVSTWGRVLLRRGAGLPTI